jgi:hypothetical protein
LYLDGPDANAGVAIQLDCSDNRGWGIYDSSFLGNTFIACHTAANGAGPYKTDDPNQRSLFLSCYAEEGQPPSEVMHCSMLIGGLHGPGFTGGGFSIIGPESVAPHTTRVDVETPAGPRATIVSLGTTVSGIGSYLGLGVPGGFEPASYLRYVNTSYPYFPYQGDWFGFNWARLDAGWSFMIPLSGYSSKIRVGYNPADGVTIDKAARLSPAFPQGGFYLGAGYSFNWFGYWNEIHPPKSGIWEETDILINRLANYPGGAWSGWIGAICVSGGTAGTYTEGRTVTSDGSNVVTLDEPSEVLAVGDFITVNATLVRIASIDGTQLTLTANIPAGTSLPITFQNPTWKRFGALEP